MKQTAVEWLADEIIILEEKLRQEKINLNDFMDLKDDLVTKALQMEKQQIIDAVDGFPLENRNMLGEEYYIKTFNKK
jgi:hypothetical protein